jgi:transcriptional regulator with XRE-family HTH domain
MTAESCSLETPSGPQHALGLAIKRLRHERGLKQHHLAWESGVTLSTITGIERGATDPKWATVKKIAKGLDISLAELAAVEASVAPEVGQEREGEPDA